MWDGVDDEGVFGVISEDGCKNGGTHGGPGGVTKGPPGHTRIHGEGGPLTLIIY